MTWRLPVACLAAIGALAVAQPWTIRPLNDQPAGAFDADAYVSSVWSSRVLPEASSAAIEIAAVPPTGLGDERRSQFVKGTGVVVRVDNQSRVGIARVKFESEREVDVQIGPVLRGTAIRDALPFVRFSDFTNQIDYAKVASSLNARVLQEPLGTIQTDSLRGRSVHVVGALTTQGGRWEITPVALTFPGDPQ
jgi:predicted lipoprotein